MKDYSDIINSKYPFPSNYPKMKKENRASQFLPFAALDGFEKSIEESEIIPVERINLDENLIAEINKKLIEIKENKDINKNYEITYYFNNNYLVHKGKIKKIDDIDKIIIFEDKTKINIDDIINVKA